jgi:hypothetical protein
VIVSEARHGLESSLRTNLPVFTRELEHARRYPTTSFLVLWRQESNARFQDAVLPSSFSPTHLGIEPVLAIPAWRDGIEVIRFAESAALPIDEYIEEIDNHRNHFEGGPIDNRDLESAGALRYKHRRWGSPWQVERPPKAYILVRDFYFNLAVSLDRWLPLAERRSPGSRRIPTVSAARLSGRQHRLLPDDAASPSHSARRRLRKLDSDGVA